MLIDFFFKTSSCVNLCLPKPPSQSLFQVLPELVLGGRGFPGDSDSKESTCSVGDLGSIPGLRRLSEGGHDNPLQYSCLENSHGQRSLASYSPWGRKKLNMTEQLSIAQHST